MDSSSKYEAADRAVKAYDDFLFSSFGRPFNETRADALAVDAADACGKAARDRTANQVTRDFYAVLRDQFHAIA